MKKKINWINVQQQLLVVNYMYMNFLLNVRYTCSISDSAYFWTLLQLWKSLNNQSAFASLLQENRTKKSTTLMVSASMYVLFKTHWALRETPTAHQTKSVITNYETITMSSCGWYQQLNSPSQVNHIWRNGRKKSLRNSGFSSVCQPPTKLPVTCWCFPRKQ